MQKLGWKKFSHFFFLKMKNVSERIFSLRMFLIDNEIMKFDRNFNEWSSEKFG